MSDFRRIFRIVLMLFTIVIAGCDGMQPIGKPTASQQPDPLPTYREVVERYNANLDRLTRVWASAVMRAEDFDEDGKGFAQGEGELIVVLPEKLALRLGKLGATTMWAGSDGERYWLMELQDEKLARVGRHDGSAVAKGLGDLPARPSDLLKLWGVQRLDADRVPPAPAVERIKGQWVIEPPGTRLRLAIDPATARPTRIDLIDSVGRSIVISQLGRYRPVELDGVAPGGWPAVATLIQVSAPGEAGKLTLSLADLHEEELNPAAFDFERLVRALKVPPHRVVDLDQEAVMFKQGP